MPRGRRKAQTSIIVDFIIDEAGRVFYVEPRRPEAPNVKALLLAVVEQWCFKPAKKGGKAVPTYLTVAVNHGC